jgi:hypothetical protein
MNMKIKMSKPIIMPSENLDDSTGDEITGKMTKTDLYTTNPKWGQFDKKLNFVDSSASNHRASFDIFNSGSYLKNESIRSTIFFEQSRKMASTLGSTQWIDQSLKKEPTFVNMEVTLPRNKPDWRTKNPFTYRK